MTFPRSNVSFVLSTTATESTTQWRPVFCLPQSRSPASRRHLSSDFTNTKKSHDEFTEIAERAKRELDKGRKHAVEDEKVRDKILDAALLKVPEFGWTTAALHAGAEAAGYPSITAGVAKEGPVDLVKRHMEKCDEKLEEIMSKEAAAKKGAVSVRDFTRTMVEKRLRMNGDLVKSGRWAEAVALMASPTAFSGYLNAELRLVDAIWHHCGDMSVDAAWYTKRISLAIIYKVKSQSQIDSTYNNGRFVFRMCIGD